MTATTYEPECGPLVAAALRALAGEPKPSRYIDILPPRADGKRGALEWFPHPHDGTPLLGFVRLTLPDDCTVYSVSETRTHTGRAFMLTKQGGKGTDARRGGYAVFCVGAKALSCECQGARGHGTRGNLNCKHAGSIEALIANSWV